MAAKVRISEQKTKFYLDFLERKYLRPKVKVTNKRAENQILFGFCALMLQMLGSIENNSYICSRYQ